MTPPLWIALAVLFCGLYALGRWARRHLRTQSVHALWNLAIGPRTDVAHMTRRELFESAGSFVTWTLLGIIALQVLLLFVRPQDSAWSEALVFGLGGVLLMSACGTVYMLGRGLLRRHAYLSRERFSAELAVMRYWICRDDWAGLESHFHRFAARTCGAPTADAAAAVDLDGYSSVLERGLRDALDAATGNGATVIVYLHRPDEAWTGAFCVYQSSGQLAAESPPRRMHACVAEVPGPACVPLAQLFLTHGDALNAVGLYLIARTVAALGRCTEHVPLGATALCMAFEGDGGLLWLRDPDSAASTDV